MKEFRLGVLFVHGIGTQPPRDTLVRWGDVLLKVIDRAAGEGPGRTIPMIGRADAGDRSGDKPAEVAVEFRCDDRDQREKWLLAEGRWADSFPAPSYAELVSWSFRAVPWAIALHVAQSYWQTDPATSKGAWLWAGTKAIGKLLGAMALTPVFMILLASTLVLGLLPIPQLRSLILSTQTVLIGSIGDSLAFVESPIRAALIRGRILEGLERLKNRCERTVIVAHSQGAAATLDALGGIQDYEEAVESPASVRESPVPDALVTFGSGVNQLVSLKVVSAGRLERKTGINAASVAVMAMGMVLLLILLSASFRSESITIWQLGKAAIFLAGMAGLGALVGWVGDRMDNRLVAWGVVGARQKRYSAWTLFTACVLGTSALHLYDYLELSWLGPVFAFAGLFASLFYSMREMLSSATQTAVTKPVRYPPGLSRWMDVYASADLVPNGPTRIEGASAKVTSVKVWNRGAFFSDHTTYWENLDGFVLRVARICAETAQSPWQDKLPPATQAPWLDRRAIRRVRFLWWTVLYNWLLWAFVWCVLWVRYGVSVPTRFGAPYWFPEWGLTVGRVTVLTVLIALAAWVAAAVLRWRWSVWVRADQEAVLAQKTAMVMTGRTDPFSGQGIVIIVLGVLALGLAVGLESEASALLVDLRSWLAAPAFLFMLAAMGINISWLANWAFPAPQPPCVHGEDVGIPAPHPTSPWQGSMPPQSKA